MNNRRLEKLAEEIKRELSGILREEIKDPRLDMVTVTHVEVSNDMSHARVMVSVLGDQNRQEEALKALAKAKGYLRTELANRIRLRHAPDLTIKLDKSAEHSIKISQMLNQLRDEGEHVDGK